MNFTGPALSPKALVTNLIVNTKSNLETEFIQLQVIYGPTFGQNSLAPLER